MTTVFDVEHHIVRDGVRDRKGAGVFSSRMKAEAHIASLREKPGFRDPRGTFHIIECEVGSMYLPRGFDEPTARATRLVGAGTEIKNGVLQKLFNVSTRQEPDFDDDFSILGYFATIADAELASSFLAGTFATNDRRFEIHARYVDRKSWTDGFGEN